MDQLIYAKYSDARAPRFQIRTEIWENSSHQRYVKKIPRTSEAKEHIDNMLKYYSDYQNEYKDAGISLCPCRTCKDGVSFEYLEGQGLSGRIDAYFKEDNKESVKRLIDRYIEFLNGISYVNDAGERIVPHANLDLIFDNIVENNDKWSVIDYEWTFDVEVPTEFILYRAIFYDVHHSANYDGSFDFYEYVGISKEKQELFSGYEDGLQKFIAGDMVEEPAYCTPISMVDLMAEKVWKRDEFYFRIYRDCGEGFDEADSTVITTNIDSGRYIIRIPYDKSVIRYRVDPGEKPIMLQFGYPISNETNGIMLEDGCVIFPKNDPWVIINNPTSEVCLSGRICKLNEAAAEMVIDELNMEKIVGKCIESQNKELPDIAVHLHLFYVDLLEEFVEFFNNIPVEFDLFISCVDESSVGYINETSSQIKHVRKVDVRVMENQGRDIAPLYVGFGSEIKNYKYFLHVHSKKSKHIKEGGADWRKYSLRTLVGSEECVNRIISYFENGTNVGLVYPDPEGCIPASGYTWLGNRFDGERFLKSIDCEFINGLISYPAGSFFWGRTEAIRQLFDMEMTIDMFPKEAGQVDGTFAHVLERALDSIIHKNGYCAYVVCDRDDKYEVGFPIESKTISEILHPTQDAVFERLMQYDTITISVMDTLFSVATWSDHDIIKLTMDKFGLDHVSVEYRLEAEQIARENRGAATTIDDVYFVLEQISPFDAVVCEQIKCEEIKIFLEKVRPREDMVELFRKLAANHKRVIFYSDTLYRRDTIQAALVRCGYIGFSELYICHDLGLSMSQDNFWHIFFEEHDKSSHIHVGSDAFADWYMLERFQGNSCWIPSAFEQFRLLESGYYSKIPYISSEEQLELAEYVKGQKYSRWM